MSQVKGDPAGRRQLPELQVKIRPSNPEHLAAHIRILGPVAGQFVAHRQGVNGN
jgi:hypothetical protein